MFLIPYNQPIIILPVIILQFLKYNVIGGLACTK